MFGLHAVMFRGLFLALCSGLMYPGGTQGNLGIQTWVVSMQGPHLDLVLCYSDHQA